LSKDGGEHDEAKMVLYMSYLASDRMDNDKL